MVIQHENGPEDMSMPDPVGDGQVLKRRDAPALLALLEVGRDPEEDGSVLPPGKRDASGFWYPARCRTPMELFTPYQRSLQEKQRSVHRERRHRRVARTRAAAGTIPAVPSDQQVPLPPLLPEMPAK
jgi:hypothetical protein